MLCNCCLTRGGVRGGRGGAVRQGVQGVRLHERERDSEPREDEAGRRRLDRQAALLTRVREELALGTRASGGSRV
jgi:hypothetical protein